MSDDYTPEPWTDARIREAFIYDGGEAAYHDPINGAREQRRVAGAIFDRWLAKVKADTLREAASALNKPAEGATYDMWSSDAGSWLRARADRIEGAA